MNISDKEIIEKIQSRKGELSNERSSFMAHWQEINRWCSPRAGRFLRSERNRGEKRYQDIINETLFFARRTLESGLMAGMSSAVRPWFLLGPPDPGMKDFGPVKTWLDQVTKIMRETYLRSNLYGVLPKAYGTCGDYATASFGLQEDDKDTFRCYPFPIGTFMIGCNERMLVDTIYRECSYTVRQLVAKFGLENVSTTVKNMWDRGNYNSWVPVLHAIEPNFAAMDGKFTSRDKAYLSIYYEDGRNEGKALRVMGYDDFPAIVPRWYVNGEDYYGTDCPGMLALGSQKALQLEERRKYQAIDKHVNPPLNADATLRNTGVDALPGGITYQAGLANSTGGGLRPVYQIVPQIGELKEDIKEVEYRIKRAYYEDLMLMLSQRNYDKTAREVDELAQEKLLVLGPLMEQFNDDMFDRLIDRTFNIMLRKGMFPKPPPELVEKPLRVEYTSIMAQAQKLVGVASIERFVGFVANVASSTTYVEILDKVNFDQIVDEYGEMTGVPATVIVPDDQVQAKRDERAKAQQAQQMAAAMPAMQQGAQAVKALGESDVDGIRSIAQMMTGTQ